MPLHQHHAAQAFKLLSRQSNFLDVRPHPPSFLAPFKLLIAQAAVILKLRVITGMALALGLLLGFAQVFEVRERAAAPQPLTASRLATGGVDPPRIELPTANPANDIFPVGHDLPHVTDIRF
jgi:hypothetical protein